MRDRSAFQARWALSALFISSGFAFGVWSAHISVFKQIYGLSNAQLTVPLFTLVLGEILAMPAVGHQFHRFDSSSIAWRGHISYAVLLSCLPWIRSSNSTRALAWLAVGTFCLGVCRGTVDVSNNTQAVITEQAYGSPIMSSLQGFWSLGGVIGAGFSSVLLRRNASPHTNFSVGAAGMIVTVLLCRRYLLRATADAPSEWAFLPRSLWPLASLAFLALFIEGAISDWSTVYLRSTLKVSAATAATGYAVFSAAMMTGCFAGDLLNLKAGARNLLRFSGVVVAVGFGSTLAAKTFGGAMTGLLIAGFGTANMVALIFGAAARKSPSGVGAGIAAASSVGYLGFLVGPPAVGSLSGVLGLRVALSLVVGAGLLIAVAAGKFMVDKRPG